MPSIFLLNEINNSIVKKNDEKFLFYSLISINDKRWNNIHPEHLKLILNGYLEYEEGTHFRNIILEVETDVMQQSTWPEALLYGML
mgnify:CR=1 FL=1